MQPLSHYLRRNLYTPGSRNINTHFNIIKILEMRLISMLRVNRIHADKIANLIFIQIFNLCCTHYSFGVHCPHSYNSVARTVPKIRIRSKMAEAQWWQALSTVFLIVEFLKQLGNMSISSRTFASGACLFCRKVECIKQREVAF